MFDLPQLVQNPIYLANSGLDKRRWATISGDFFQSVPKGGDAYILKRVLHDWSDEKCVSILRCCRQAIGDYKSSSSSSCLLVVDAVVPAGNIPHHSKVSDILMMVLLSGHERTEQEFRDLFEKADFKLTRVTMTPSSLAIVEAIPA